MFYKYTETATIEKLTRSTDDYTRSSFVASSDVYKWHLRAMTMRDWITMEAWGKSYTFTTNIEADISEGDRLTMRGIKYDVQGVSDHRGVTFDVKKVLLNRSDQ